MTIVVGVICVPKGNRKPFALLGSDTKFRVLLDDKIVEADNQEKVFPFNKMFLGIAGAVPDHIFEDLPNHIRDLNMNFDKACEWLEKNIKSYLDEFELEPEGGYWRTRMTLIAMENNIPKMAKFEYDTRDRQGVTYEKKILFEKGSATFFIGNTSKTIIEQEKFKKQLSFQTSILNAKKLMESFMEYTADVYPVECNKIFQFGEIEGEKNVRRGNLKN